MIGRYVFVVARNSASISPAVRILFSRRRSRGRSLLSSRATGLYGTSFCRTAYRSTPPSGTSTPATVEPEDRPLGGHERGSRSRLRQRGLSPARRTWGSSGALAPSRSPHSFDGADASAYRATPPQQSRKRAAAAVPQLARNALPQDRRAPSSTGCGREHPCIRSRIRRSMGSCRRLSRPRHDAVAARGDWLTAAVGTIGFLSCAR